MKRSAAILLAAAALSEVCGAGVNLLPGDPDFEREWTSYSRGTWGFPYVNDGTFFRWDRSGGYESASCVRMMKAGSLSSRPVPLPAGTYTLSGWFRAEEKPAPVSFFALPQMNSWQGIAKLVSSRRRRVGTEWTRLTYTFTTDGAKDHCVVVRNNSDSHVRVDRLMINRGKTALPWEPGESDWILLEPPPSECCVYPVGQDVAVTVRLHTSSGGTGGKLRLWVEDARGKTLLSRETVPAFDEKGDFTTRIDLPRNRAGWYAVRASFPGMREESLRLAVIHPAAPLAPGHGRFTAVYHLEDHPRTARLFGDLWSSRGGRFSELKQTAPPWKFPHLEELKKLKAQGRKVKFSFGVRGPAWMLDPAEKAGAAALKVPVGRLLPAENMLETAWRPIVGALLDAYGKYVDIFECSGEIDASIGCNSYYKSKEPDQCRGYYVFGSPVRRAAKQISITSEEIFRRFPGAVVSGVRPSDVDSHFHYLFCASVLRQVTTKGINSFGLDCYPRPRWIGPGRPPAGTEQQLTQRWNDASAVLKKYGSGRNIFISEYGYFIDCRELDNPHYTLAHARLYARSLLKAKALGMSSFFCFDGFGSGLEGGIYHMGIWYRNEPLPAAAAIAEAVQMVENVTASETLPLNAKSDCLLFRYADGSAGAALWSFTEHYEPEILIPADRALRFRDFLGGDLEFPQTKEGFRARLRQEPLYIRRNVPGEDNFARLKATLAGIAVNEFPAEVIFRPETLKTLKMHLVGNFAKGTRRGEAGCSTDGFTKKYPFTLQGGGTATVRLPFTLKKPLEVRVRFEGFPVTGQYRYTLGRRTWVRKIEGPLAPDGTTGGKKTIPGLLLAGSAQIAPFDHNTWTGNDDLSIRLRLGHDGKFLYITAVARDDRHFGSPDPQRPERGDCLQLAFDPLLDHLTDKPGRDDDDFVLTAALTKAGAVCRVTEGRDRPELQNIACDISRDDQKGTTTYQIKLPLAALGPAGRSGAFFGFDFRLNDDDTGGGPDCWVFWRNTFDGKGHPERGEICLLE